MRGEYFYNNPAVLRQIADDVDSSIRNAATTFSEETQGRFVECRDTLLKAYSLFRRIDRLMSGGDSELTFRIRLEEELSNLEKRK